jgi:DNA-binding NarL/FixJ family response regulator
VKVLVVDDNELYRKDLVEFLKIQDDVEVVGVAKDGEGALRLTDSLRPDLILMDVSMPGMGGLEAARSVKLRYPWIKVVFVTIHEERTYQILADILEVDGFVCKSSAWHDIPKMLSRMREMLDVGHLDRS